VESSVPHIGNIAGKEVPRLAPVGTVVVEHLAAGEGGAVGKTRVGTP
jgi:hypothetical protein